MNEVCTCEATRILYGRPMCVVHGRNVPDPGPHLITYVTPEGDFQGLASEHLAAERMRRPSPERPFGGLEGLDFQIVIRESCRLQPVPTNTGPIGFGGFKVCAPLCPDE